MKKITKLALVGVTIASTIAAGVTNSNSLKQLNKCNELSLELKKSFINYDKLLLQNKKLSKRVVTEINRILSLSDSIKGLDQNLKKNELDLLTLSAILEKSKSKRLSSRASKLNNKHKLVEIKQSITKPIYIENIDITPMRKRIRGGFTETGNYKKIDGFKTNFQILNNNISNSNKRVILKLTNSEDTSINYKNEVELNFDQHFLQVDAVLKVERKKITSGNYKLIVLVDNTIIKTSNIDINLK